MKLFRVPVGTKARALRDTGTIVVAEEVTLNRTAIYEREELAVDPIHPGDGPTIGDAYANAGWYGFRLPTNARRYSVLLVRAQDVQVMA